MTQEEKIHIIDADKLLEFLNVAMEHSKICSSVIPINSKGEYDCVSDIVRHLDLFTYNQLKVIRDYIIENRV